MKKRILVFVAGIMLCASMAIAATPAAPVFNLGAKSTKVADGFMDDINDNRQLAVDGNNVYVAFNGPNGEARIVRSTDGGLTWGIPALMSATGTQPRIVKVKDPLYAGKSLIAATWADSEGLMYSYFAARPTGAGWSTPVVIPGTQTVDSWINKLVAAPNGSLHLFFGAADGLNYITATSAESTFGAPVVLPWGADWNNFAVAVDGSNNLYAVDYSGNTVTYHKKTAGSSVWSNVPISSNTSDNVSIAVFDANNIYIAYKESTPTSLSIWVAVTNNGGKTWTRRPVTPNSTVYGTYPSITVNSSKVITVVGHYVSWGPDGRITVNKSSDNGATWSANVNVVGTAHSGAVLDANGKVCIVSSMYGATESDPTFFTGTATDWNQSKAIYFSREK